jgi:hypothetical protein
MRSSRRQLAPEEERLARETITAFLLTQNGLADQVRRISTVEGVP